MAEKVLKADDLELKMIEHAMNLLMEQVENYGEDGSEPWMESGEESEGWHRGDRILTKIHELQDEE